MKFAFLTILRFNCLFLFTFLLFIPVVFSDDTTSSPSRESLVQAWEKFQETDSSNIIFKKTAENTYRFKTTHFPYDGTVKLLNAVVNPDVYGSGFISGFIEIELDGIENDFWIKHRKSYDVWDQTNTLYFDSKQGKWLRYIDYTSSFQRVSTSSACYLPNWQKYFWSLFLLGILLFLWLLFRSARGQFKRINDQALKGQDKGISIAEESIALSRRAVEISKDSNKILKEILESMQKK